MLHKVAILECDVCHQSRSQPYTNSRAAEDACLALGWALRRVAALDRWGRPSTRVEDICPECRRGQGPRETLTLRAIEGERSR